MEDSSQINFKCGSFDVSMTIQNGVCVDMDATDENGTPCEGGCVFIRNPITLGCMVCRRVGGSMQCWEVNCASMARVDQYDEKS